MFDPGDDNQQAAMDEGGFNHANQRDNEWGGTHYTITDDDANRFSWDTDSHGNHVDGSAHASYRDSNGEWQH